MITSSIIILTCSIHRQIISKGKTTYRKIPIEFIIAPCPAQR